MNFDARQLHRKRILDRIILAAQVVAVLYLATHVLIAWRAYEIDGIWSAALTFVSSDLATSIGACAGPTKAPTRGLPSSRSQRRALCFTSWATRGMFNRWAMKFSTTMLEDFGSELGKMRQEAEAIDREKAPGEGDDDKPGGGARPLE